MRIGPVGTDDQVGKAVTVDVACRGHGDAEVVIAAPALQREAVAAVEARQIDIRGILRHVVPSPNVIRAYVASFIGRSPTPQAAPVSLIEKSSPSLTSAV